MQINALVKAVAFIMWADEKIEEEEWVSAKGIFEKYKLSWEEAKPLLEEYIEVLIDESEEDLEEVDETLDIGSIDFGDKVDRYDVLNDLAGLVVADKVIDFREIDVLHTIAKAVNAAPEMATASLLNAVSNGGIQVKLDF
jgi:uncharacterized tellurite resistance protein B-like protein